MGQVITHLSQAWQSVWGKMHGRILMVGLDAAGKTTILYKLRLGEVVTTVPTIGFNVETVEYKNVSMQVWDIGGQDKIRKLWRYYFQGTNAVIFVVDSSDRDRIDEAREELMKVIQDGEMTPDVPVLILGNKQDLPNAMSGGELRKAMAVHQLNRPWYIQSTCATTGDGLYEGLDWLASTLSQRK